MPGPDTSFGLGLVRQPKTVIFGPGRRAQVPHLAAGLGRHALIVTDERMAASADFAALADGLAALGLNVHLYADAAPDLPRSCILDVIGRFGPGSDRAVDVIIGLGGGSCLDLAKIVSVCLTDGTDPRDFYGEFKVPAPGLPVIGVPTTGGTGAEVTCIAVIFDDAAGSKVGVASPHLEPVAAVIDPELTLTCPPGLTAATAADALSHLVEAYTARYKNPSADDIASKLYVGKNRITDLFVEEGLRLIDTALPRVVADPTDLDARGDMMFVAYCAGMAINATGTAAAHAIQGPMAAISHAPHGFGVGALLPYVTRFNLPARRAAFARIGAILGAAETADEDSKARHGIARIEALLEAAGAPLDLAALDLRDEHLPAIAAGAMQATRLTANNPREMTEANVLALLRRGLAGDRSWWVDP